ncbi:MAG: Rv3235 family protein [Actinophytocola sp.]|uniref:Rv3235 family protein n=1 Tax=Actinophytocola sp. TaxID=1872138 RepID=UPI003D6A188A
MSAPVRYLNEPGRVLRALPEYEPTHAPGEEEPRRWSSLRPASGPQLTLVAPPRRPEAAITPEALWRLLVRVLEVLEGRRAAGQLRTLLSDSAYEALLTRLRLTTPGRAHRLRRLRACYPSPVAVEVAAVIDIAAGPAEPRRVCALAARLERVDDVWHCVVLRML